MSIQALCNRPCTIIRRYDSGDTDDYGDAVDAETSVETTCELQQASRDEPVSGGETSSDRWNAFFWDTSLRLQTDDAVVVDGVEYELVGEPWVANSGTPAVHHLEATLVRTAGPEDAS